MMVNKQQPKSHDLGPPKADFSAPPPYECSNATMTSVPPPPLSLQHGHPCLGLHEIQLQHHQLHLQLQHSASELHQDMPMRHGKLPTYEEVQLAESFNGGELPPAAYVNMHGIQPHAMPQPLPPPPPPPPPNPLLANIHEHHVNLGGSRGAQSQVTFVAIDTSDGEQLTNATGDNSLLGTDTMFVTAFMVAFLFNWIGFLMLTCFCPTIAGRYGALSGFGLSLAKWTLIVKQSTDLASHENSWLWWLIMAFGFLICARALIQYVSIKRTWRLLSASAQERLLFFY